MYRKRLTKDNNIKRESIKKKHYRTPISFLALMTICLLQGQITGCNSGNASLNEALNGSENGTDNASESKEFHHEDGFIRESEEVDTNTGSNADSENATDTAAGDNALNTEFSLSVPTYVTRIDNKWFIVDCYHDQIIYSETMGVPLNEWKVLTKAAKQPHTIAGDGEVILVDDTENNRVLVFEKSGDGYVNTQSFSDIGKRPHYTVYDDNDKAFYVWSSTTGEMYIFRHEAGSSKMYLTDIKDAGTKDTYIRSFYMNGDEIYFVSGLCADGTSSGILVCDKRTFEVKEKIDVPDELAGMVALRKDGEYYYITISTDIAGSQDAATMIRTRNLHSLINGDYEEIYSKYFVGGGTPYNITEVDGTLYLTEHRVPGHSVWSYRIENDDITDVQALY